MFYNLAIICDFGLAKISNGTVAVVGKLSEQIGLSPRYAAPELFSKIRTGAFSRDPVLLYFFLYFPFIH